MAKTEATQRLRFDGPEGECRPHAVQTNYPPLRRPGEPQHPLDLPEPAEDAWIESIVELASLHGKEVRLLNRLAVHIREAREMIRKFEERAQSC